MPKYFRHLFHLSMLLAPLSPTVPESNGYPAALTVRFSRRHSWGRAQPEVVDGSADPGEESLAMGKSKPYNGFLELARRPNGDQSENSMRTLVS